MVRITRTLNPLHFEDLEPKRFEDLVRQLLYDFRNWRQLEATGRSGGDDGFDARGWETLEPEEDDREREDDYDPPINDRIWLIQCKRERSISPSKISKYLDDVLKHNHNSIYGIIFVGACDFSKKTRDIFHRKCSEYGLSEGYLWGKAEMEDMLLQPKNDHLLFAYFGISLVIRARSLKTKINAILTIKRKVNRHLSKYQSILVRDPKETKYPYSGDIPDFSEFPKWKLYQYLGSDHSGLKFLVRQHFAYVDKDRIHWDFIEQTEDRRIYNDPWETKTQQELWEEKRKYEYFWSKLEDGTQSHMEIRGIIPYENIMAIDELGDAIVNSPHLYVEFNSKKMGPFKFIYAKLKIIGAVGDRVHPELENRIKFFPKEFPEVPVPGPTRSETGGLIVD